MSPAYLSQVETGKETTPAPERLEQLERILDLSPGVLTALTDRVDPRVLEILRRMPASTEFLLAAEAKGLSDQDFARLALRLRTEDFGEDGALAVSDATAPLISAHDAPTLLTPYLDPDRCFAGLVAKNREELFVTIVGALPLLTAAIDADAAVELLNERETAATTAIGNGVAIPHAFVPGVDNPILAVATLAGGCAFTTASSLPVTLAFFVFSPKPPGQTHVRLLARIARLCRDSTACEALRDAPTGRALYARLRAFDRRG